MKNLTISAIIPVCNSGLSALKSIQSVINQTHACTEIIVINDGSTDNSLEVIENVYKNNKQVKIYSTKNNGAAEARNHGVHQSTSDLIAFLDSDDTWHVNKIEIQIAVLERNKDLMLLGSLTNMKGFRALNDSNEYLIFIDLKKLLFKNYFQTSSVILFKSIFKKVDGFPKNRRFAEEGDLYLKVCAQYKCAYINEILVNYSNGKDGYGVSGLSANLLQMEKGELLNIKNCWSRNDAHKLIMISAFIFSVLKFIRRLVINKFRK